MTAIMLIFTIALFAGTAGTPLVRKVAIKSGFIAIPKADRAHTEPTALMGGLAIYTAAISGLLLLLVVAFVTGNALNLTELVAIMLAGTLMSAVGLWDDRKAFPAWAKLVLQVIPVVIVFLAGVQVSFSITGNLYLDTAINFVVTTCWILYITNAVNYLDNADGTAIMTSATTSAFFLLIAIFSEQQLVSALSAAILGASLGFARYNLPLPKSTIFMGDSGSLFLGFLLAILGIKIRVPGNVVAITWMVPVIILALPIFDTVMVFISRTRRGVSFFRGGVDHTTHRLARLGMDKLSVAFAVSIICGVLGLISLFITQANQIEAYVVFGAVAAIFIYALWRLEFKPSFQFRTGRGEYREKPEEN